MFAGLDFQYINEVHYATDETLGLVGGDRVIARTVRAKEVARVVTLREALRVPLGDNPFVRKILRKTTDSDAQREEDNRLREKKAHFIALRKIERLALPMKLIRVHYLFDHSRIVFYFKAATKVDFRQLVRDLAAVFKTRIELRQIGVRDEAKILGGTGSCGRELCCTTFLRGFAPVTVKMAKLQHHTVNPSKISGQCGRLKCCIAYEYPFYEEVLKGIPPIGTEVDLEGHPGRLVKVNLFTGMAEVIREDGSSCDVALEKVRDSRFAISQAELEGQLTDEERAFDRELSDRPHRERSERPPTPSPPPAADPDAPPREPDPR
jgi:cell fate regulator YaaT (PSP1 superfamily)